jgi:hypothetical protein
MALIRPLTFVQLRSSFRTLSRLARLPHPASAPAPAFLRPHTQAPFHASARQLQEDDMADRPTGLKANKGIELLTFGTPNGVKASIILEELKEAYGMDYTW